MDIKQKARAAVRSAIRSGRLKRLPCEVCADPKSQGHHEDYQRPLYVRWVCPRHHKALHSQFGAGVEIVMVSISMPPSLWRQARAIANEEFEGNISRYVRSLIKSNLKGKAA